MKPNSPVASGSHAQRLKTGPAQIENAKPNQAAEQAQHPNDHKEKQSLSPGQQTHARTDMKLACPSARTMPPPLSKRSAFLPDRPTRWE